MEKENDASYKALMLSSQSCFERVFIKMLFTGLPRLALKAEIFMEAMQTKSLSLSQRLTLLVPLATGLVTLAQLIYQVASGMRDRSSAIAEMQKASKDYSDISSSTMFLFPCQKQDVPGGTGTMALEGDWSLYVLIVLVVSAAVLLACLVTPVEELLLEMF